LKLASKFKRITFNIYGDRLGNIYKKSPNVKLHGYINYNQVPKALYHSDILILPSDNIQFGRAKGINIATEAVLLINPEINATVSRKINIVNHL